LEGGSVDLCEGAYEMSVERRVYIGYCRVAAAVPVTDFEP